MDLKNLLNLKLWLNTNPGPLLASSVKVIFGIFIILAVLAIMSKILAKRERDNRAGEILWQKFFNLFFWLGLVLLVILFFSKEGLPILGMRLWYFVLFIVGLIWLGFIIRYAKVEIPRHQELKRNRERFNKYLPKKKKK